MAIRLTCPECGKELSVRDELAGRRGKCPGCGGIITVPDAAGEEPALTAQPVTRRPRKSRLWPVAGALAMAAIAGVFIFVVVQSRKPASERQT